MTQADGGAQQAGLPTFQDMSVREFLAAVASGRAAPGGGSAAAAAVGLGAALCAMAARLSSRQLTSATAAELAAAADDLASTAAALIQADAESFQQVLAARQPRPGQELSAADMSPAAAIPMQVIETATQVARLAARLVVAGNPNLRGDAVTGLLLAQAGAKAASVLVEIDLGSVPADDRRRRAAQLLSDIADAASAALR